MLSFVRMSYRQCTTLVVQLLCVKVLTGMTTVLNAIPIGGLGVSPTGRVFRVLFARVRSVLMPSEIQAQNGV